MRKILIYFFIFLIIISIFVVFRNKKFDSNTNTKDKFNNFCIEKIKYYSNCNAITNIENYQNPEWNVKIYQYTDIAIYLDRLDEINDKNYITSISLNNFELLSNQEIYYLNPLNFGNNNLNIDDILLNENGLEYNVINDLNENNEQNYNIPIFFQDCSNPITLRFVNVLADNYKISNEDGLIYNGKLIEKLGISLNELNTKLNFNLEITTKDGQKKSKKIELQIPVYDEKRSILDGDFEIDVHQMIEI